MSHPLIRLARAAISAHLDGQPLAAPDPLEYDPAHRETRACFVTLMKQGRLRGCIGSLQARQSLLEDVMERAVDAAFHDRRFDPLRPEDLPGLDIEISILGPTAPFPVEDEMDLLEQLRPGIDGLILYEDAHRATFLPSVWEQLPAPRDFVRELKRKAGLSAGHWSTRIRFERYTVEKISGPQ